MADANDRFAWLPETPPRSRAEFQPWLDKAAASEDPLYSRRPSEDLNQTEANPAIGTRQEDIWADTERLCSVHFWFLRTM